VLQPLLAVRSVTPPYAELVDWSEAGCRRLAGERVGALGARWKHVGAVGRMADALVGDGQLPAEVGCAAWLHDIGYASSLAASGFHPLDGAQFLLAEGAPQVVVSLVAYHSGAMVEAEERGLAEELSAFVLPPESDLDALTLLDMSIGPDGARVEPADRIAEILRRYESDSPVHRAVTRSRDDLLGACDRARRRLGLADKRRGSSV
jgi:hypothetical protein